MSYTQSPIPIATNVPLSPEYMRLPRAGERDPICGLPRSVLNELILPCKANGGRPPVRSVVLRRKGALTGIRLVDLASLRAHLDANVEPGYVPPAQCSDGPPATAVAA